MSPNFSNEYHPVVAEHIRAWGELESRIAGEPRFSPGFNALLAQYHNARYKAKRMTELDRQSRGGVLSAQAEDEYFQLLSSPGPFNVPPSTTAASGSTGSGSSSGGLSANPNLGSIGAGFSRIAQMGSFLETASTNQTGINGNQGPDQRTLSDNRPSIPVTSTSTPRRSPTRPHPRRGSMPFEESSSWPRSPRRFRPLAMDEDRDRNGDRDTGRGTAGTSSTTAAASTAASESLPSSSHAASHSLPPESPSATYHSYSSSHPHSLNRSVPSSLLRPQRSRTLASMAPDIETDRAAETRRRQVRERVESEWESQRPVSATSSANAGTNRTSIDSTIIDAIMSDVPPSSQSSDSNGSGNSPSELVGNGDTEAPPQSALRRNRPLFLASPSSEPWSAQLLGESDRNQTNEPTGQPSRGDGTNNATNSPPNTMTDAPIPNPQSSTIPGFPLSANQRPLRNTLYDHSMSGFPLMSTPESQAQRSSLTSPNRLSVPPNFLPSLPHLPAPRFSPPRNLTRPRASSISNNNASLHGRNNSTGSEGFPPANNSRRRERTAHPLVQALGSRADVEREDYESPIRTMFVQNYEEYQRAEERRRMSREMEVEQRDFLGNQDRANPEATMRRLQEHRNRHYELLHRANLQRQIDQLHAQSRLHTNNTSPLNPLYPAFPIHHHHHNHNHNPRSPDEPTLMPFGLTADDDQSSNSDEYEDMIPLDNPFMESDNLYGIVDGFLTRPPPNENTPPHRSRHSRIRRPYFVPPDDSMLSGNTNASSNRNNENERDRQQSRFERNRRYRENEIRTRQNEALRDIAGLVDGVRNAAMFQGWRNRQDRDGGTGAGRNNNNNNSSSRTLDHPERPDNMKEEDLKIMVDCKVCYGQIADIVLLPCAHLVLCQWCAETVAPAAPNRPEGTVTPRSNCPVCRTRVEKKIKVYRC
ncbi:hypothetical protein ABW19_dt0202510 [Dactylella cylindrospora]|nr:hypothetical protein ABW19_dt0202510 [Dactylella cylindrospora]